MSANMKPDDQVLILRLATFNRMSSVLGIPVSVQRIGPKHSSHKRNPCENGRHSPHEPNLRDSANRCQRNETELSIAILHSLLRIYPGPQVHCVVEFDFPLMHLGVTQDFLGPDLVRSILLPVLLPINIIPEKLFSILKFICSLRTSLCNSTICMQNWYIQFVLRLPNLIFWSVDVDLEILQRIFCENSDILLLLFRFIRRDYRQLRYSLLERNA